ncbi:hypothetical protein N0V93_004111 [Gnomoniopsis smithogilvyi]|uniref:NACHT domain-containing protein n=1 Tax=Gnomoniopsis smithogilvyi TaxID=1191159 RepID=A0A9W8YZZ6_9PEZI|nr:hypothetical protein N0V93_004111 [Gnomoniopsis smithogilvyi]
MAEALTLLGLVANVLQFVDLGRAMVASAREAYNDAKGLTNELRHIQLLLEDISNTRKWIETHHKSDLPGTSHQSGKWLLMSADEIAIWEYSKECETIAASLERIIGKLRIREDTRSRRMESVRVAVVGMAKKGEVQKMAEQLEHLDRRLRNRLRGVLDREAMERQAGLQDDMLNTTVSGFSSVLELIDKLDSRNKALGVQSRQAFNSLRVQLLQEIRENSKTLSRAVLELIESAQRADEHQKLLQSLLFPEIKQRYSDIQEAHSETLSWLFEDEGPTGFPHWLKSPSEIFWVSGLAGSGKSTLMKYVFENPQTKERLSSWTGGKKLFMGSFYFWNQGTAMQKSLQGLMQSLLLQIARSDPELAKTLCQHRPSEPEPWTLRELRDIFGRFPEVVTTSNFCFLVDGLDEYDGEEEDVISFVEQLAACPSIKICVSSRPWNRFQEAFGQSDNKLLLEDLTRLDIQRYVEAELAESEALQRSIALDPRCLAIAEQVAGRAQGVFLWVFLVVRSLKRDLKSEESFEHLQRRIDELPPTLNSWFRRIFQKIDPIYRKETARLLLITLFLEDYNLSPMPLLSYDCLEAEVRNPDYAVHLAVDAPLANDLSDLPNTQRLAAVRLNDRCRDLMQPRIDSSYKVNTIHRVHFGFLHRTVRDFLREHYIGPLQEQAGDYWPARSLTRVYLYLYKRYPIELFWSIDERTTVPSAKELSNPSRETVTQGPRNISWAHGGLTIPNGTSHSTRSEDPRLRRVLAQFWDVARTHEAEVEAGVMDEFNNVATIRYGSHWTNLLVLPELAQSLRLEKDCKMLAWAAYLGLTSYLRQHWEGRVSMRKFSAYSLSPLDFALNPSRMLDDSMRGIALPLVVSTVQVLLEGGCSPNFEKVGYNFLLFLSTRSHEEIEKRLGSIEDVYQVTMQLFRHGLRIPSVSRDLYQANFESIFAPLFGIARVNELWTLHELAQRELTWKDRLSKAFQW